MIEIQGTEYLTTTDIATHFDVALQTVRRWCDHGLMGDVVDRGPGHKPRYFIPAEAIENFTPPSWDGVAGWKAGKKRE
jgi:hypothetical protein